MRVIAGLAKGRRLVAPPGDDVRPTSDRVKEALFSVLHTAVIDAAVLDLYAGAGSLGIEALSRGARHVTFVERARKALSALDRNLDEVGLGEGAHVVRGDVAQAVDVPLLGAPFDLVLMDPPYAIDRTQLLAVLTAVVAQCAPGAIISVELGGRGADPRWPDGVLLDEPRRYGDTVLHVGHVADPAPSHEAHQ